VNDREDLINTGDVHAFVIVTSKLDRVMRAAAAFLMVKESSYVFDVLMAAIYGVY
jgi:hypothetical protein